MTHHGEGLFQLTKNRELVDTLTRDYRKADLTPMERKMLDYAIKVTLEHCNCKKSDTDELRDAGFKDVDILDIVEIAAYYNYVNRMACGLGVELEPYWDE